MKGIIRADLQGISELIAGNIRSDLQGILELTCREVSQFTSKEYQS
jgi:hypothetical protein